MAEKNFKPHMMYKGKETEKADTYQEHLKLKKMGFGHEKGPFKMKSPLKGKRGLWDNIHAKRKRIKAGSGETMRKPGSKGAPSAKDFKDSQ